MYAIGECTEHRGLLYGIVAPLNQQARVLAAHLRGDEAAAFEGGIPATTLKVAGVHVFSAGAVEAEADDDLLTLEDTGSGIYKRVLIQDRVLRGAILVGDLPGPGANKVQLQTVQPITVAAKRFLTGSMDIAAFCTVNNPSLSFFLVDGAQTIPLSSSAIAPCTDSRSVPVQVPATRPFRIPRNRSKIQRRVRPRL